MNSGLGKWAGYQHWGEEEYCLFSQSIMYFSIKPGNVISVIFQSPTGNTFSPKALTSYIVSLLYSKF